MKALRAYQFGYGLIFFFEISALRRHMCMLLQRKSRYSFHFSFLSFHVLELCCTQAWTSGITPSISHHPRACALLLSGMDIRDVTQQSLRQAVGMVPQVCGCGCGCGRW